MSQYSSVTLPELVSELDSITESARQTFGHLDESKLNWKPGPEQWSIAQCFDHLIATHRPYIPVLEKIARRDYQNTLWQNMPLLSGLFGRFLIKALDPNSKRKLKAPPVFQPSQSEIDASIIATFAAQQETITDLMKATKGLDLNRIKISSPALGLITYSLFDAYRIMAIHERRHFGQAERVMQSPGFPH